MTEFTRGVMAFENAGEWHYVADDRDDLFASIGSERGAGQCAECGSFDQETGEPGAGFIVREVYAGPLARRFVAECACCKRERPIVPHAEELTVF